MTETKKHALSYLFLVLLVSLSLVFAESGLLLAAFAIVGFSAFKFLVVSFQFVEVKKSHPAWKAVIFMFIAFYILILTFLN